MRLYQRSSIATIVLALALGLGACSQNPATEPAKAIPTTNGAASPTAAVAKASPTVVVAAASPTTAPTRAVASPTAGSGLCPPDLTAKAKSSSEYSFEMKTTSTSSTSSGKTYVKTTRLRSEMTVNGQSIVMLVDASNKVAYMLQVAQKTAIKMDFSQATSQVSNPNDQVSALPADAKLVGNDNVDDKAATVCEATNAQGTTRYYIWNDRGLPLRTESTTAQGKTTTDFTNYQFGPQADSLFELPPGTTILDLPSGIPGLPTGVAIPKP